MNFQKIAEKFVDDALKQGSYASKEEILKVIYEVEPVLKENKDKSLEEIVFALLPGLLNQTKEVMANYPIPGYVMQNNTGIINVTSYGGNIDDKQNKMSKDAIFDIASISKLFTQIIFSTQKAPEILFRGKIIWNRQKSCLCYFLSDFFKCNFLAILYA